MSMNLEFVEQIVALIGEYPVSEISVEQDGRRISVRRPLAAASFPFLPATASSPAESGGDVLNEQTPDLAAEVVLGEEALTLTAMMVGIFHHATPPIPYAALLTPGQVIGSIESMKLMNDVVAETGGRVTDVLIEDGAPVEYGQALFRLAAA